MNRRVLITGARAPAALHLARLLDGAGHHVVMADSLRWPVGAASRAARAYVRLPAANGPPGAYGAAITETLDHHGIDLVIPTCEEVFHLARLWADRAMAAALFAPDTALLAAAHNKFAFTGLAQSLGLAVPDTALLTTADDLLALDAPARELVFKPVWSRFATRVLVRPDTVRIRPTDRDPWVAQEYIAGTEICAYAIAHHGVLTALSAYRPTYRAGKGAGIAFAPETCPAITDYLRRFVSGTGWHGQLSFDFIRKDDGALYAIECNPRTTSGVHFFAEPARLAGALLDAVPASPDVTGPMAVKAALALYGPRQRPLTVWRDLWRMPDVIAWPGDRRPVWRQFAATLELAGVALRHRISLTEATTQDIAWDGR